MGLDIYLYRYENFDAAIAWEKHKEEVHEKIWARKDLSDTEKSERCDLWDKENPDPADAKSEEIEINSKVHPEHMFKIGYCRSSYNAGGIERILDDRTGKNLHYIFGNEDGNEYKFSPDWAASLVRAREARDEFAKYLEANGSYGVTEISPNIFGGDSMKGIDGKRALEMFQEQRRSWVAEREKMTEAQKKFRSGSFSMAAGDFWMDGVKVVAAIHGEATLSSFAANVAGKPGMIMPAVYLVYEREKDDNFKWYQQALEIVVEMIEWVLAQPEPAKYRLHWSG